MGTYPASNPKAQRAPTRSDPPGMPVSSAAPRDRVIGRARELEGLDSFGEAVAADGPRLLLIEGPPGIGKSTLLGALVDRAGHEGWAVFAARPSLHETRLAFSGLVDLMGPVEAAVFEQMYLPQRRALEAALLRRDPDGPSIDRRAVSAGVLSVVQAVGRVRPLLIAIDDAQWLDLPTVRALEFAARRIGRLPVGIAIARRSGDESASASLDAVLDETRRVHMELGPLAVSDLEALVAAESHTRLPRNVVRAIGLASDGNPMLAREMAGELSRHGPPPTDEPLPLPESLRSLVAGRVERLPARTLDALFVVANLANPLPSLVDRVLPSASESLSAAFDAKVAVVRDGKTTFGHPLYASAVHSAVSPDRRRELHRAIARVVDDPEERAQHLALAADRPDRAVADALEVAADRARARGAPDAVAAFLDRALALTPARLPEAAERRRLSAAGAHLQVGDLTEAREMLERTLAGASSGRVRAEALHLLAEVRYLDDSYEEALALLEQAVRQAGADDRLLARIHLDLALARFNSGDVSGALAHTDAALALAGSMPDDGLKAAVLASASLVALSNGGAVDPDRVARALELEDWDEPLVVYFRPSYCAAFIASVLGDLATACKHLDTLRCELMARGLDSDVVTIAIQTVQAECMHGDIVAAARIADEAVKHAEALGSPLARGTALAARAWAAAWRGRSDDARSAADEALALLAGTGGAQQAMYPIAALGFLALSEGDDLAAEQAYAPLVRMVVTAGGPGEPAMTWAFLPDAVEPLVNLGRLDVAESLTSYLEERGASLSRPWAVAGGARCRALMLAAAGDLLGSEAKLTDALRGYDTLGMPLDAARTLLLLGRVRRRARRRAAARDAFERASRLFEEHGAALWAERVRTEAARLGQRRGRDQLTNTEERVAHLIASGLTVRAVAAALFLSPKTVEACLSRVYGKLGISSRAELGARMAAGQEDGAIAEDGQKKWGNP